MPSTTSRPIFAEVLADERGDADDEKSARERGAVCPQGARWVLARMKCLYS